MKITTRQKAVLYGLVLGNGYLQRTGAKNARLRLEHSEKQKEYLLWKIAQIPNLFNVRLTKIKRKHPQGKIYSYLRLQSNSSPMLGRLRQNFYQGGAKIIPNDIGKYLCSSLTLAVWYMDDGYYYRQDNSAHLYLSRLNASSLKNLVKVFQENYRIKCQYYCRPDRKSCQLNFTGESLKKLSLLIKPYIIPSMRYKLPLDPVTTESENIIQ